MSITGQSSDLLANVQWQGSLGNGVCSAHPHLPVLSSCLPVSLPPLPPCSLLNWGPIHSPLKTPLTQSNQNSEIIPQPVWSKLEATTEIQQCFKVDHTPGVGWHPTGHLTDSSRQTNNFPSKGSLRQSVSLEIPRPKGIISLKTNPQCP